MKIRSRTPLLNMIIMTIMTASIGLGLGSCGDQSPGENEANVQVVVQGLSTADNVIDVVLPVHGGNEFFYCFAVSGDADLNSGYATFTLDIHPGLDCISLESIYTVNFALPFGDVNAQDGETGYGQTTQAIVPGSNDVVITFEWNANPPPVGDTNVDLVFSHDPRIVVWSKVPGPGKVGGGDIVAVQADVEFYGDGLSETVTVQFWDDDAGGGSLVGTPGSLSGPDADGLWTGTVTAVSGADALRLTASDSEGTTISEVPYAVP